MPEISGKARSTINGTVKLRVRVAVNAEGKVSRATLAAHGPSAYFARQALEAARQWTFTPPVRDGKPQASDWMLRFEIRRSGTRAAAQQL
jgi:TonB family protein